LRLYEAMVVVDDARCSDDYGSVAEHVRGILRKSGAEIKHFSKWDERRLAYRINRHTRGVYLLVYFTAPPESIAQINRDCTLSDIVVRILITVPASADVAAILQSSEEETAGDEFRQPDEEEQPAGAEAAADKRDSDTEE